jgi:hypothetical protein
MFNRYESKLIVYLDRRPTPRALPRSGRPVGYRDRTFESQPDRRLPYYMILLFYRSIDCLATLSGRIRAGVRCADVRVGSPDIRRRPDWVCFTPQHRTFHIAHYANKRVARILRQSWNPRSLLLRRKRKFSAAGGTSEKCQQETHAPHHYQLYSITSSAATSRPGGTVRPSAFAVLRLTTRRNRVGCSSGRSAGFSPFRTRRTRFAPRSAASFSSGP